MTATEESNLVLHARRELELCGQTAEDPEFAESLIGAVRAFASYGHSGGSAMAGVDMLTRLLRYEALSPLTSDPSEWMDRSEESGVPMWQNKRDPAVFSEDAGQTWKRLGD
jgi:hypothetical protein